MMLLYPFQIALALLVAGCQTDGISDSLRPVVAGATDSVGVRFVSSKLAVDGSDVAAADFNNDGYPDLIGGGEPLQVFLGDSTGTLSPTGRVPGGESPTDFALGDLDRDDDIDIVVANHATDYVTILLGDVNGGFQPAPSSPLVVDVDPHPHAVELVDVDGDGKTDLVIDDRNRNGLLILRGSGNGDFVVARDGHPEATVFLSVPE
jgi:hypothetical protein